MRLLECGVPLSMLLCLTGMLSAEPGAKGDKPSSKPAWQRLLGPKDQEQAEQLQKEIYAAFAEQKGEEAIPAAQKLLQLRERVQGANHWQTVDARFDLQFLRQLAGLKPQEQHRYIQSRRQEGQAQALEQKGLHRQAQPLREDILEICRKILGEEDTRTASAYHNLAMNQKAQGKYAEAKKGYRKALEICRKTLGEEHPDSASVYGGLASNQNAQGKYAEAEEGYRKALEICRKTLGEEHPATAASTNNLAMNQQAQGKYAEAEQGLLKALEINRKLLGEEHPNTAFAYNNLAKNQSAQGKYAEAEQGLLKALEIKRKTLGEEHPATVLSYGNLAMNQQAQGKYAEAEMGLLKALQIRRKILGEEHPDTASAYNNLAGNQSDQGKHAQAEQGYRKALEIRRKILGEEHPDTASVYNGLAMNQQGQGKYAEAEQDYRKTLEIRRKILGEEHPDTASAYNGLAMNQQHQGKYTQAELGYRKALEICRKTLGEEHPQTAQSYNNLAGNQHLQGKYAEAEMGLLKALTICRKSLGEEHHLTVSAYNGLAMNQQAQGKYAEAEMGFLKALEINRKILGEEHPRTGDAYDNLASNQRSQGKYAQAEEGYHKALEICRKILGEEHPKTLDSYNSLAFNQQAQGKYAEAEALYAKVADLSRAGRFQLAGSGLERSVAVGNRAWVGALPALLARNGKPEQAWQRYEQSLARGLADDLSARLRYAPADQARLDQLLVRQQRLEQQLLPLLTLVKPTAEQEQQRQQLLDAKLQTLKQLQEHQSHLEKTYGPVGGQSADWKTIQAALPPDTALLGWVDFRVKAQAADSTEEHWAFLLRSSGPPLCVRLLGSGDKQGWTRVDEWLLGRLLTALQTPQGNWQESARALRQQRLAPLEKHLAASGELPAVRRLVVLPSFWMDRIPVEVIAPGYQVSYALSGTHFAQQRRQPRPDSQGLLALGDPVFELPAARKLPLPEHGLMLTWIAPQSNAAQSELRPGDVLLRYGMTDLHRREDLALVAPGDNPRQRVPIRIWRLEQQEGGPVARTLDLTVRPGALGVTVAKEPAPQALAQRRRIETELAQRGGDDWKELPGTRCEVQRLTQLFQASKSPVKVLLDSAASEQSLDQLARSGELGRFRYLHLATHGISDPGWALRSRLILSRDRLPDPGKQLAAGLPPFDGELTAEKILRQWNLKAELVTLSACETALGQHELGERHIGFAQTLLLTGTRSVVLSLWKVDDNATALFMERFYQNLLGQREGLTKPLPKAEALTDAKHWLRTLPREEALRRVAALGNGVSRGKDRPALPRLAEPPKPAQAARDAPFAHPYYWAAFVLFGDPE